MQDNLFIKRNIGTLLIFNSSQNSLKVTTGSHGMSKTINSPLISIILPIFNSQDTLERTLNSVQSQSYKNFEVLMINDASTDDSKLIAQKYLKDDRFKLINLSVNTGVANARNKGLEMVSGEYICFLDSDDWWKNNKLKYQLESMLQNNVDLSHYRYNRIDESTMCMLTTTNPPNNVDYEKLMKSNHIGLSTAMIKKTALGNTRFKSIGHEDFLFWLEILRKGYTASLVETKECQCFYLVRKNSLSSNKLKAFKWQWLIYRRYLNLTILKSCSLMFKYSWFAVKKRFFKLF